MSTLILTSEAELLHVILWTLRTSEPQRIEVATLHCIAEVQHVATNVRANEAAHKI